MKKAARKTPDHDALYHLAEPQAGYFTAQQAAEAGFSWERLTEYSKNGRFQRLAHGIYRLAQFPSSRFEDLFAAWLKCGPNLPSRTKVLLPCTTYLTFSRRKFTSPFREPPPGGERGFVCTQIGCGLPMW